MKNREAIENCVSGKFTKSPFFTHNQKKKTKEKYAESRMGYVREVDGVYIGIDKRHIGSMTKDGTAWVITELLSGNQIGIVSKRNNVMNRMKVLTDAIKKVLETEEMKEHIKSFNEL